MSENPDTVVALDEILQHTSWLRHLARALFDDPHSADDAVQDAVIEALRQPAGRVQNWAGWFRAVLRRNAAHRTAANRARRRHERSRACAGGASEQPAAAEVVAKAALQRRVVGLVLGLSEPYRSTLLLRFFEDRTPKQVAAELGVPIDTVYARVRRGLQLLRGQLDRHERDWRTTLLPFAFADASAFSFTTVFGVLSMSTLSKSAAGALGAALLVLLFWTLSGDTPQPHTPVEGGTAAERPARVDRVDATEHRSVELDTATGEINSPEVPADSFLVRGHVRQFQGPPLEHARVRAQLFLGYFAKGTPAREDTIVADAHGRVEWALTRPDQTVSLRFLSAEEDRWTGFGSALVIRGADAPKDVRIQATPLDVWVSGRVLGPGLQPLPGARIRHAVVDKFATAGDDGAYRIRATSGSSDAILFCVCDGFAQARAEVATRSAPGSVRFDFHLKKGAVLRGRVRDADEKGIADVSVQWSHSFGFDVKTTADGRFTIRSLDPTRPSRRLTFRHTEYLAQHVSLATADLAKDLVVTLQRGARVSGRVFGPDDAPVPGAELRLFKPRRGGTRTLSRDDGSFCFDRAEPGDLTLEASRAGLANTRIDVSAGASGVRDVIVRMSRESVLAGRVLSSDGKPIGKHAGVVARRGSEYFHHGNRTDARGHFRIGRLPVGIVTLEVYATGHLRREIEVQSGREDLEIVLPRAAGLAGRVVQAVTGLPVEEFRVRFVTATRRPGDVGIGSVAASWIHPGTSFQKSNGEWSTAEIGSGEFHDGGVIGLEITATGYAPHLDRRVVARVDPDPDDFVVRLQKSASVRGRVVTVATGAAIANATVRIVTLDRPLHLVGSAWEHASITARTDAAGSFVLHDVPIGRVSLRIEHRDHPRTLDGPFELESGARAERLIQIPGGTHVDGTAPPGATVHVRAVKVGPAPDFRASVHADASGGFRIPSLAPGRYQLYAIVAREAVESGPRTFTWHEARVDVEPDARCRAALRAGGSGGLHGRAARAWRKGRFRPDGRGPWVEVPVDDRREFHVSGLPPGAYEVQGAGTHQVRDRVVDVRGAADPRRP